MLVPLFFAGVMMNGLGRGEMSGEWRSYPYPAGSWLGVHMDFRWHALRLSGPTTNGCSARIALFVSRIRLLLTEGTGRAQTRVCRKSSTGVPRLDATFRVKTSLHGLKLRHLHACSID